ncbi:hypothetical protein Tco_0216665 [Tanacetum coccineum]
MGRKYCLDLHMGTSKEVLAAKGVKLTLSLNLNTLALVEAVGVKVCFPVVFDAKYKDIIRWVMWSVGISIEATADQQKLIRSYYGGESFRCLHILEARNLLEA